MQDNKRSSIRNIAEEYFSSMAKNYPVMCVSDEFCFFPRAAKASQFLSILDNLEEQKIKQNIAFIKNLLNSLHALGCQTNDLETQIDAIILRQSMSTFLREFEEAAVWRKDPTLYMKILLFGIDQLTSKFSFMKTGVDDALLSRIAHIPQLLRAAMNNLKKVPLLHQEVALEMIASSIEYFTTNSFLLKQTPAFVKEMHALTKKAVQSLLDFRRFLQGITTENLFIRDSHILEATLEDSFSYTRNIQEIFEISSQEYEKTLKELENLAQQKKSSRSWQDILTTSCLKIKNTQDLLGLYSNQIESIKNFLLKKDAITIPKTQNVEVQLTPGFMKPIRASASYCAPFTKDMREPAYFYIAPALAKNIRSDAGSIHNEYIFVTAHETYPGHHLLDSIRRHIKNPIRQQIESPLFYEGWASYAERLIDEVGYTQEFCQKLLRLKRKAWRAIRAMLDVGIRTDRFSHEDAQRLLEKLGYNRQRVRMMVKHYTLNPGYQLCYTIGDFEIERLKRKFASKLGLKRFHDCMLEGGQIPFDLIEKRLQEKLCQKNS
ncbi:MAG: DUF885 domain-containing protein [Candidatus Omnitrophota bacterium]|nr:MAG: DUF885 domain-containing protein [Candidatus Omnitrophota bacterium]